MESSDQFKPNHDNFDTIDVTEGQRATGPNYDTRDPKWIVKGRQTTDTQPEEGIYS